MNRTVAAFLATAISLAGIAAVFAAVAWFMHAASFLEISPRFGRTVALTTSITVAIVISAVVIPLANMKQQRTKSAEPTDPAPRLWMRAFQPDDE